MMLTERLTSLAGIFILVGVAWLCSENRGRIQWKTVFGALVLELAIGALVFLLPQSTGLFLWLNRVVIKLLSFASQGALFLFGALALSPGETGPGGETSLGFFLAFQMLPAVIFFSALMSLLYHFGVIQPFIRFFAVVFKRFMRLSGAESLCASSNIFVGIEAVFSVRPFLDGFTRSEFLTILTPCMATTASTTLAIYVAFLSKALPTIAGHLISASVLAIPASILISKIMIPETDIPLTMGTVPHEKEKRHSNFMGAVSEGAWEGLKLAAGIAALLIAVLGLVAVFNAFFRYGGSFLPGTPELSIEKILGWLMVPFAWCLGIRQEDLFPAAQLLGERWILTEVIAYRDLAGFIASGMIKETRTIVIMSYALCGFAHVASVGIFVGGISALVPSRRDDIAALGLKALWAAFLATLMTGCIAGLFFSSNQARVLST
jgi:CNT family concentrative nucleoside transporter